MSDQDSQLTWTLAGPRGIEVLPSRRFTSSDSANFSANPALDLVAGAYTLTVNGSGIRTGSYSFRLLDLGAAAQWTPGTSVSGTLSPGSATDLYKFEVQAGDRFYFDMVSTTGNGNRSWQLPGSVRPAGVADGVGVVHMTITNGTANLTANITGSLVLQSVGGLYLHDPIADAHHLNDAASFTGAARFETQLQGDRPAHEPEVR